MTIKRQILNFNQHAVDVRIGSQIMDELPRIVASAVGKPCRALIVSDAETFDARGEDVRRALVDAGFRVASHVAAPAEGSTERSSLDDVQSLFIEFERAELTADDLVFAMGSFELCSKAAFCARLWRSGTACALMPTQFEAMVSLATEIMPLGIAAAPESISLQADPSLVLCDLSLIETMARDDLLAGYVLLAGAALAEGKKTWTNLCEQASLLPKDVSLLKEALAAAQVARRNVLKASNPSARRALRYGRDAARALARCGAGELPRYALLAEGMRFEARLAVDAVGLDPEVVFAQDDIFFDMGIEDACFTLDADRFVSALHEVVGERTNRFLLPLPKAPGMIRLSAVSDDILMRHASAYAASLLSE